MSEILKELTDRFLRYVNISSQSRAGGGLPSTPTQLHMAQQLEVELELMDLEDLLLSNDCILTGYLPANLPENFSGHVSKIGFCCHLDTADINLSPMINPHIVKAYPGGDVTLNPARRIIMKASEHPELAAHVGEDIVFSDGTSVLGADDKAGIANLMTALHTLSAHPDIYHGDVYVAFVPDEEVGLKGSKALDLKRFPVDFSYTIDGGEVGEITWETFNAGSCSVSIQGVSAHPMNAKGNLVNPSLLAVDFVNYFDRSKTPEHTEGREGYIWVKSLYSNASRAEVTLDIREHDRQKYQELKQVIADHIERLKKQEPRARVRYETEDIYSNIADAITPENRKTIDLLQETLQDLSITPRPTVMRGGTDGSALSAKGLLTPNYFTGGLNFHSKYEFLPLPSLEKSYAVTMKLIEKVFHSSAQK